MARESVLLAASARQVAERHIPFILITDLKQLTGYTARQSSKCSLQISRYRSLISAERPGFNCNGLSLHGRAVL